MTTLVVTSGLPGVGKTSIAKELARRLSLVLVELDHLEAALFRQGIRGDDLGWAGYDMITTLASDNLTIGHSVLLDAVGWTNVVRRTWSATAAAHGAGFRPIEIICSDERTHRERLERRRLRLEGLPETTWHDVEVSTPRYEVWDSGRLVLDTVFPLESLIERAIAYINESPG